MLFCMKGGGCDIVVVVMEALRYERKMYRNKTGNGMLLDIG